MGAKVVNKSGQRNWLKGAVRGRVKVKGLTEINGWFYYRPAQKEGRRPPRVALGTRSYEEAVRMALEMHRERPVEFTPGTFAFEKELFLQQRRDQGRSRWTLDSDASVLRLFGQFLGMETPVVMVTERRVEGWLQQLREGGASAATVKTYLLRIHAFLQWLQGRGTVPRNVADKVKVPLVRKTRAERFCTREERDRLIDLCDREDVKLMLMLGFHAGLRLREMIEARPEWLRFWPEGGEICVMETSTFVPKDKEARRIPMNDRLCEYLRGRQFDGPFLVRPDVGHAKHKYRWEPRKPLARLVKAAGLPWVGWHTLRHTYATLLVMGGCPIASVAQWLGDGIEVTFKNYVGYAPAREHVNAGL